MDFMKHVLIAVLVFIPLSVIWVYLFQTINPDVQYRVIRRGDGYGIQKRGPYKWSMVKAENGDELIFADKIIAGMIVAEALKKAKEENTKKDV